MLGKRKRELAVAPPQTSHSQDEESGAESSSEDHDVFRRYFESTFKPLPHVEKDMTAVLEAEEEFAQSSEEGSDWEGLSDPGMELSTVEVVEHKVSHLDHEANDEEQRQRYKDFMVSHLPPNQPLKCDVNLPPQDFETTESE